MTDMVTPAASTDSTARHRLARGLLTAARVWVIAVTLILVVQGIRVGPPADPEGAGLEQIVQWALLVTGVLGLLLAWRWPALGGAILIMAGISLGVAAVAAFTPEQALAIAIIYSVPGLLFLASSIVHRPHWQASLAGVFVLLAFVAGGQQALGLYDHYYGAAHPASDTTLAESDLVEWAWSGAVTPHSVLVNARIREDSDAVRLVVQARDGGEPHHSKLVSAAEGTNNRVVSLRVGGLDPATSYRYWVEVDGEAAMELEGAFGTFADGPQTFSVAFGSDARLGSNGAVYDAIREAAPDLYLMTGDMFYADIAVNDRDLFRDAYNRTLATPAQSALYRSTPLVYGWDDHDFGENNSNADSAGREAAQLTYRQFVPHYPLEIESGAQSIYHAFTVGRVRFVLTDTRSERISDTMLGEAQLDWLEQELLAARDEYALIVVVSSVPWIAGGGADHWGGYPEERRRIADFLAEHEIRNLVMLAGDAHMLAIDDGTNSDYSTAGGAGFPVMHAGALDRPGAVKGGPYSEGSFGGAGQFGLMTIIDEGGSTVRVEWSGRDWTSREITSLSFTVSAEGSEVVP